MGIIKYNNDSLFDQIKANFLDDNYKLSPAVEARKIRLHHAFSLRLRNKYSRFQVVDLLQREYGISQSTAYRDYNLAMQLYGDLDETDKNAERTILADSYWQLYQMALKNRNIEQARKALDSYASLFNFGVDEQVIDPNKIQAHEYHIHLTKSMKKLLENALSVGVVDFTKTQDVDYEEVKS